MRRIKKVLSISISKTLLVNYRYFGWEGLVNPIIIISKNTKLKRLSGNVFVKKKKCRVYFGFVDVGIFDKKYERSIWDNNGIFQFEGSAHFG